MMITKLVLIALMELTSNDATAGDDWLCTSQASQRRSNSILACGVATSQDETTARTKAFDAAMVEFHKVCDNSIDCKDHEFQVMPQRTECMASDKGEKCYRLLQVYIGHKFMPLKRIKTVVASVSAEVKREVVKVKTLLLRKGLTKSQVIASYGKPYKVMGEDNYIFFYKDICQENSLSCMIAFEGNRVDSISSVDTRYMAL